MADWHWLAIRVVQQYRTAVRVNEFQVQAQLLISSVPRHLGQEGDGVRCGRHAGYRPASSEHVHLARRVGDGRVTQNEFDLDRRGHQRPERVTTAATVVLAVSAPCTCSRSLQEKATGTP